MDILITGVNPRDVFVKKRRHHAIFDLELAQGGRGFVSAAFEPGLCKSLYVWTLESTIQFGRGPEACLEAPSPF